MDCHLYGGNSVTVRGQQPYAQAAAPSYGQQQPYAYGQAPFAGQVAYNQAQAPDDGVVSLVSGSNRIVTGNGDTCTNCFISG